MKTKFQYLFENKDDETLVLLHEAVLRFKYETGLRPKEFEPYEREIREQIPVLDVFGAYEMAEEALYSEIATRFSKYVRN